MDASHRPPGTHTSSISLADTLLLASVPILLLVVAALPLERQRPLRLAYDDPTLPAAYLAHFLHLDVPHLLVNGVGFLVSALLVYACLHGARRRDSFRPLFVLLVVTLPLALTLFSLVPDRTGLTYGASGLVMAWVGALPVAVVWYARRRLSTRIGAVHALALAFLGLGAIAILQYEPGNARLVAIALAAGTVSSVRVGARVRIRALIANHRRYPGRLELPIVALLVYGILLVTAFPGPRTLAGQPLNLYSHLLGFVLGFGVAFGWYLVTEASYRR